MKINLPGVYYENSILISEDILIWERSYNDCKVLMILIASILSSHFHFQTESGAFRVVRDIESKLISW